VIGLDTNVLCRLAVGDDPDQAQRAADLLDRAAAANERLFVPDIVLCELAWVLQGPYAFTRADVVATIGTFLEVEELAFRDPASVTRALAAHARGAGDFADHLIAATALAAGCDAVATFDKALHGQPGFVPV
jgi:predicted nucleic-acid-binding protein